MTETKQMLHYLFVDLVNQMSVLEENQLRQRGIIDLTIREVHVIEAIGVCEQQQMNEVAQRLQISMGTLTVVVKRLIDKNYVVRRRDLRDRRIFRLDLTPAGQEVDAIHQDFHREMIDELAADFMRGDQVQGERFLHELVAYFERYSGHGKVVKYG
ncbi:MAG: MarR family winged helix-turn-helix transcriptional regulator [Culicoidibacterales bacterium]